jgi:choline transport protein
MATLTASNDVSKSLPDYEKRTPTEREPHSVVINETGHVQELERNFSLLSVCSVGIVTGNTWAGGKIIFLKDRS